MPNERSKTQKPKAGFGRFLEDPTLRAWAFGLFATLATFLFYLPTLSYDFVNLDDPQVVLKNPLIQNLSWTNIRTMFTTFHEGDWMPLTWLSLAFNYWISGDRPWSYHLTNNILHALNSAWVFLAVRALLRSIRKPGDPVPERLPASEDWTALLSAILFGLHPIHVESVAWVTERKDVLYGFFFLAAFQTYLTYAARKDRRPLGYALCLTLFILSSMGKTAAVTLPVLMLGLDLWPLRRLQREGWGRPLLEKVPFFMVSIFVGMLSLRSHDEGPNALPLAQEILKPLFAFFFYLWKTIFPFGLSPLYPTIPLVPIYVWGTSILALLLVVVFWAAFRWRRERPGLLAALLFYLVTMAPNLAILLGGGHEGVAAADHYTYIPLLGFFVPLAAWAVARLQRWPLGPMVLALALTAGLGSLTLLQASLWKDGTSLWYGATKIYPNSALIRLEMANIHLNAGLIDAARMDFEFVRQAQPGMPTVYRGLGVVALKQGRVDEAIAYLQQALSMNGNNPQVWVFLWKALTQKERHQEALDLMKNATQKDPDAPLFWNLMGSSYGYLKKPEEAVQAFQKALKLDPGNTDFLLNLGDTYLFSGKKPEAMATYQKALQGAPDSEPVQCLVGESYLKAKMAKEALGPLKAAWAIKQAPRIAADLERAYRSLGQKQQADEYARALKAMSPSR